eukprot:TRINITY_DN25470_c0_g1_i3.p1 TRINITY_DN25470_c0_g1~~TRINITY_DN25470_c0_g1_i3.p1  ORF type:complete len:264 (+),score=36.65 TRINITY_DN25470_c0_g1_i3:219-1010(+)
MGLTGSALKPTPSKLEGCELLSAASSQRSRGRTVGIRLGLRVAGECAYVEVTSQQPLTCVCEEEKDLCEVMDELGGSVTGVARRWKISVTRVKFEYVLGDQTHEVTITGKGLLKVNLVGDDILWNWEPDTKRVECPLCSTQFTSYYRKHHCRCCGRVVCGGCSDHLAVVTGVPIEQQTWRSWCCSDTRPDRSVRVCRDCYYGPKMDTPQPSSSTLADSNPPSPIHADCYYDPAARLHISRPSNSNAVLMHYNVRPHWDDGGWD